MKKCFTSRGLLYDLEKDSGTNQVKIIPVASEKAKERHQKAELMLQEEGWEKPAEMLSKAVTDLKKGKSGYDEVLKSARTALQTALENVCDELEVSPKGKLTVSSLLGTLNEYHFFEKLGAFIGNQKDKIGHDSTVNRHHVLYVIYGVDNAICYLIGQRRRERG